MTNDKYRYDQIFDQPQDNLLRQEFVTYKELDGVIIRTTVVRTFYTDDYVDSTTSCRIG